VSVVVETENEREAKEIGLREALRAIAAQTYPRALTEVIVVDSGDVPDLCAMVREWLPTARILTGAGLSEYQMKNLAARAASGSIVAMSDGDCAPSVDWLDQIVRTLTAAPPTVVGVQGRTVLRSGLFCGQVSALLYGLRTDASGRVARRIVSDNCALRADFLREIPFEHAELPTTPETILWTRMARAGRTMVVNERVRSTHDYPKTEGWRGRWAMFRFLVGRAYSNGYCMTRVRFVVPGLRAGWTKWLGPAGPPVLVVGKMIADLGQIASNNRALGLGWRDWIPFLPLYGVYYGAHLAGGFAAILGAHAPRS
jgi:hypothetical protein